MNPAKLNDIETMGSQTSFVERRQHKRFRLRDGGIALMTPPGPYSTIVGHILDISTTGLSFRYLSDEALGTRAFEVTIASAENKAYVRRLPIQTVSDFEIAKMPFGTMSPRRYGLQFDQLTEDQASNLQRFIVSHRAEKGDGPDL
jgi:hypothetical protein